MHAPRLMRPPPARQPVRSVPSDPPHPSGPDLHEALLRPGEISVAGPRGHRNSSTDPQHTGEPTSAQRQRMPITLANALAAMIGPQDPQLLDLPQRRAILGRQQLPGRPASAEKAIRAANHGDLTEVAPGQFLPPGARERFDDDVVGAGGSTRGVPARRPPVDSHSADRTGVVEKDVVPVTQVEILPFESMLRLISSELAAKT